MNAIIYAHAIIIKSHSPPTFALLLIREVVGSCLNLPEVLSGTTCT